MAIDLAPADLIAKYEPVIGLEVHVQLGTRTKFFVVARPASEHLRIPMSARFVWDYPALCQY